MLLVLLPPHDIPMLILYPLFQNNMYCYTLNSKGKDAKSVNVLAENDIISLDVIKENLAYTLVTQREPDNQVDYTD